MNHPTREEIAARKAYQLAIAQEVGLTIPLTLITNDPDEARKFIIHAQGYERTVYKAFSATQENWRETRLLEENELTQLASVAFAPVIFQEYIAPEVDLRITVVGERIFATAIYSQETGYKIDYRMDMARARMEALQLPMEVEARLPALMMRLTPDGHYIFLGINPSGQWLFVAERSGQAIIASFARLLANHNC